MTIVKHPIFATRRHVLATLLENMIDYTYNYLDGLKMPIKVMFL